MSSVVDREALKAAASRYLRPGITPWQAIILGYCELVGEALDAEACDDAALLLRAERLVIEDVPVGEALAAARREAATWAVPPS